MTCKLAEAAGKALFLIVLCVGVFTEAREIKNETQLKPGELVNKNSVPVPPPSTNTLPPNSLNKDTKAVHAATTSSAHSYDQEYGPGNWCIADPYASDTQLDEILQFVCNPTNTPIDCSTIQFGGKCYKPENKVFTASVVLNLFYQSQERKQTACNFNGSGLIIHQDPSSEGCIFPPH